jgi:diguanylate cyclase
MPAARPKGSFHPRRERRAPLPGGIQSAPRAVRTAFGVMAVLLLIYVAFVVGRGPQAYSSLVDGWGVDSFELAAAILCLLRAARRDSGRPVALMLGFGMLSWIWGDVAVTVQTVNGVQPSNPNLADFCYLGFFPLTYIGLVLFLRREVNNLARPNWLDGAVAGMGAAALCAAFAFHGVVATAGGNPLGVAVNLAYPVGDVLLLALVVTGSALLSGRARVAWVLVAAGLALDVAGSTVNLFGALSVTHVGNTVNAAAWPASLLLIALAVWIPNSASLRNSLRPAGFVLPGLATAAGVGVLFFGTFRHPGPSSIALATLTLVLVGARLGWSVRTLRTMTLQHHNQAVTDHLTGLGNRRHLFAVLEGLFQNSDAVSQAKLAFLFIDLDHFKEVNDAFGHPAGDELLRQVADRLSSCLRDTDILVRLGGDEFAVLLLDADGEAARSIAQRLTDSLEEPFPVQSVTARIGASIGIAMAPDDALDAPGLMWCADTAMYRAKQAGSNFAVYDVHLDDEGDRLYLAEELRSAIRHGRLVLHYQQQLDIRSGNILGVEALVRWPHPQMGLIPPLKFIPLAEESGLMAPLTEWVLETALEQAASWRRQGRPVAVSVNVSPTTLTEIDLVDLVARGLVKHNLPAEALIIEITETSVISERAQRVITDLHDRGIEVSIDDFGAGFTSLAHLGGLAVGELKLDATFVTRMTDEPGRELVRGTIELAHGLGLRVVAEGIEDNATLARLAAYGCDVAQGYHIARPAPADQLEFEPLIDGEAPRHDLEGLTAAAS